MGASSGGGGAAGVRIVTAAARGRKEESGGTALETGRPPDLLLGDFTGPGAEIGR